MTKIMKDTKQRNPAKSPRFFSRPADRSLTAYKEWIRGMYEALVTQAGLPVEEGAMTEAEWVSSWKDFWEGAEKETEPE